MPKVPVCLRLPKSMLDRAEYLRPSIASAFSAHQDSLPPRSLVLREALDVGLLLLEQRAKQQQILQSRYERDTSIATGHEAGREAGREAGHEVKR